MDHATRLWLQLLCDDVLMAVTAEEVEERADRFHAACRDAGIDHKAFKRSYWERSRHLQAVR